MTGPVPRQPTRLLVERLARDAELARRGGARRFRPAEAIRGMRAYHSTLARVPAWRTRWSSSHSSSAAACSTWLIAHAYYRRSSVQVPEWARPLVESLPEARPSRERLIELSTRRSRRVTSSRTAISATSRAQVQGVTSEFETTRQHDERFDDDYLVIRCKRCGWSDFTQL